MKIILLFILAIAVCSASLNAQTISAARAQGAGATVTLTGIALNGPELGVIRYLQDSTAGIAVYSASLSGVQRGDTVTVTGLLVDYNNLLEMNPLTSFSIISSGNPLPAPFVLTPLQILEPYEGELIQVQNAVFANGGSLFALNTNYNFTAGGEPGVLRITGFANTLIGTLIPTGTVNITAIASQFTSSYQILPRDLNDISDVTSIYMVTNPTQTNTLFPNPATTSVHLHYYLSEQGTVQFFDMNGRIIKNVQLSDKFGDYDFDVSAFPDGTCFYQVITQKQVSDSGKLVIVR